MGVEGCLACDLADGRRELPGGVLLDTGAWLVEHCVGPLGVGTLVVKPRRHVTRVSALSAAEAAELGPLLRRTAAAVEAVVPAEQVYTCLWSHAGGEPVHVHYVVQPVTRAQLDASGLHGPRLQVALFEAGEEPARADVEALAVRVRALLAEGAAA